VGVPGGGWSFAGMIVSYIGQAGVDAAGAAWRARAGEMR
jgi:hypothetical protein